MLQLAITSGYSGKQSLRQPEKKVRTDRRLESRRKHLSEYRPRRNLIARNKSIYLGIVDLNV